MNLLIVESPTKTKTISKYLKGNYEIKASVGHIRDLPKSNKDAVDIAAGFKPRYEIIKGKEKAIDEIKNLAQKSDEVILATDPDREGEAIAWHIAQILDLDKLKAQSSKLKAVKRIVFHEITESAVKEALTHPREIDMDLVKAQEARRILDRLVGYDLSGLIWKKVRYGLSAGRVQSPALRIIMEREREIRAFVPESYWVIVGEFALANTQTRADLTKKTAENKIILTCEKQPKDEAEAKRIIKIAKENSWKIIDVAETEVKRSPKPPFITSTLQQTASSRLGFAPSKTMMVAQKLYEQGLITYMRTDSVNLNKEFLPSVYQEIEKKFGGEYVSPKTYATKSKTAQEAHEAIRPTDIKKHKAGANEEQDKLYRLIWQRTISCQMADAKISRTKISANIVGERQETGDERQGIRDRKQGTRDKGQGTGDKGQEIPDFSATGSIVVFDGWLAADTAARGEDVELPKLNQGDSLNLLEIKSEIKQTEPPGRYTEAGLIKELEKREIGRPSTYASIIKTILGRGYATKDGRSLKPTDTGEVVSGFLEKNFAKYISDSFTAEMENELDEIAEGKMKYEKMLSDFYGPFQKEVKEKDKTAEKITNLGESNKKCPLCGGPMVIKLSRTGKFLSCKEFPKCPGALKMDGSEIAGPKETGEMCQKCKTGKLVEREGRFGKFIACSNYPKCKFVKTSPEEAEKAKTGIKCPKCKIGDIISRRNRKRGMIFYGCSNYPDCNFIMKSRPIIDEKTGQPKTCKLCGSLMMQGTNPVRGAAIKGELISSPTGLLATKASNGTERCSNKDCQNHKLKK